MSKINDFPELTTLADDDLLLCWDSSTNTTTKVQLSTLKTFIGVTTEAPLTSTSKQLTYSADGDINGLCYFLGTNKGTANWQNPHNLTIKVSASAIGAGGLASLVDRQASEFYTSSALDSWVQLTIFSGTLKPNYYSIRNRNVTDHYLRNWALQGSNNNSDWTSIDVHTNDTVLNSPSQWLSLPVVSSVAYKNFRLLMTGINSAGYYYLCLGEIELYGTYFD